MFVEKLRKLDSKLYSRFQLFAYVNQNFCIRAKNMPVLAGRLVLLPSDIYGSC